MNLKNYYYLSTVGVLLSGFGAGWITLSEVIGRPLDALTSVGLGSFALGLVIVIKTLSTIRKIDLVIEDE